MAHVLEPATSGRSMCRGCARPIGRGELRFGERLPNPYGQGEMTLWFHPACAAFRRPEPLLQALGEAPGKVAEREALERGARSSLAHRRIPRIDGAERSPSGQARCRSCHETIERGSWRVRLVFYEGGRFTPGGYLHLGCRDAYFEAHEVMEQILHFSPDLSDEQREELRRAAASG
jgi:Malate dehydrogenase enzyme